MFPKEGTYICLVSFQIDLKMNIQCRKTCREVFCPVLFWHYYYLYSAVYFGIYIINKKCEKLTYQKREEGWKKGNSESQQHKHAESCLLLTKSSFMSANVTAVSQFSKWCK